ncbi:MAG: hypothetical protein IKJ19_01195 [Clostridia bacterium]|nr:hypothetical protein [Clostridia bacterium]
MKFWFGSDGKSAGGKRFFARVEEVMVDKDGKPVYKPTPSQVVEPKAPEAPVAPVVPAEPTAPAATVAEPAPVAKDDAALASALSEVLSKVDVIIDLLSRQAPPQIIIREVVAGSTVVEPTTQQEQAPVAEALAEVAPVEEAPVEEPVQEEVAATAVELASQEEVIAPVVLAPVEEAPAEEPAQEAMPIEGEVAKAPAVRSRSFAEKMRDADEILQDRYDELKNYALRFRKLKSRISKKFDSINQGRFQFVKLSVAGKTLKLYLNMDINTTDPKFHCKDMSDKKTYVTVPTMLRIKSGRAVKYAKMLIDQCAEQYGMLERRKPFVVDAMQLIEESLAGKEPVDADVDGNDVVSADAE